MPTLRKLRQTRARMDTADSQLLRVADSCWQQSARVRLTPAPSHGHLKHAWTRHPPFDVPRHSHCPPPAPPIPFKSQTQPALTRTVAAPKARTAGALPCPAWNLTTPTPTRPVRHLRILSPACTPPLPLPYPCRTSYDSAVRPVSQHLGLQLQPLQDIKGAAGVPPIRVAVRAGAGGGSPRHRGAHALAVPLPLRLPLPVVVVALRAGLVLGWLGRPWPLALALLVLLLLRLRGSAVLPRPTGCLVVLLGPWLLAWLVGCTAVEVAGGCAAVAVAVIVGGGGHGGLCGVRTGHGAV